MLFFLSLLLHIPEYMMPLEACNHRPPIIAALQVIAIQLQNGIFAYLLSQRGYEASKQFLTPVITVIVQ